MEYQSTGQHGTSERRVLIVDDDPDFANSLDRLLTLEGYEVCTVYNKADAHTAVTDFASKVALIDIRLHQSNGLELLTEFLDGNPEILCIMMTAYASVETTTEALRQGAYDYLRKPFSTQELLATLNRCFERLRLDKDRKEAVTAMRRRNLELEYVNDRLDQVVTMVQELSVCATNHELCAALLADIVRNLGASGGSVYLREAGQLVLIDKCGPDHAPITIPFPLPEDSVFNHVIKTRGPVLVDNLGQEDDLKPSGWDGYESQSLLAYPLIYEEQESSGVLSVHAKKNSRFTMREKRFGQVLVSFGCEAIRTLQGLEDVAKSEERLRTIIDNLPSAVLLKDFEGRYQLVNKRFEEWFGHNAPEVAGKTSYDIFPKEIAEIHAALVGEVLESNRVIDQEMEVPFADGSIHSVLVTKFPVLDPQGNPMGVGSISLDVTDRKRVDEQLRQAQKMEAVGLLTGGIAHDFNNIMTVILGNLELIKDHATTTRNADLRELTDDALGSARSGAHLTNQLLVFGRRQTLHPQTTDIGKLVTHLVRLLQPTLGDMIEIEPILATRLWKAKVDRNQLETSLLNLAINARDAMPKGGRLVIEAANTTFGEQSQTLPDPAAPGQYVMLAFRDNGCGMTPDIAECAPEPFFTTKEVGKGSGLGLSMVHGFVSQTGGHMEIDSQVGEGTTVRLYIPKATKARRAAKPGKARVRKDKSVCQRILVVEDKPDVRKLIKNTLTQLGHEILEASNGEDALALLAKKTAVDLLFTDIVLPGAANGVQLAQQARLLDPGLKIIYTSGYPRQALVNENIDDKKIVFVSKPFQRGELARAVQEVLKGDET